MRTQTILNRLVARIDEELKPEIVSLAAFFEHRVKMGSSSKAIVHIEAMIAAWLARIRQFALGGMDMLADMEGFD